MNVLNHLHHQTPEDAKGKKCPMSADRTCDGPDCMAWRWHDEGGRSISWVENFLTPKPLDHWIRIEDLPNAELFDRPSGRFIEGPTKGYCGMV